MNQPAATELPQTSLRAERLAQAISTAGLVVLHVTVWFAAVRGLTDNQVVLFAGGVLTVVGFVIAVGRRWKLMAHAAVGLGLASQVIAAGMGISSVLSCGALVATALPLLLLQLRAGWNDVALSVVGFSFTALLVVAVMEQSVGGGSMQSLGIGAWPAGAALTAWVFAAAVVACAAAALSLHELRRGQSRAALALAAVNAAGVLLAVMPLATQSALWLLAPGALGVLHGVLLCGHDRRSMPGTLFLLLGTALCVIVAAATAQGMIALCAGLAGLGAVALYLAAAQQSSLLQLVGWAVGLSQLVTLALGHPCLHSGATSPWTPAPTIWSLIAAATALQLGLATLLTRRGRLARLTPRWVSELLTATTALLALAASSTLIGELVAQRIVLTLLWAGCAALCWWLGRRRQPWLKIVGGCAGLAAVIKLVAVDWAHLEIVTRLALLLLLGGLLLVGPLIGLGPRVGARTDP